MKYLYVLLASLAIGGVLAGCGGDSREPSTPAAPATPVTPATTTTGTDFQSFVRQLLAQTTANADPTPFDSTRFTNLFFEGDPQPLSFYRP
jgi:ABC-type glycerol-3-phosphate transport system substrate-binding protein